MATYWLSLRPARQGLRMLCKLRTSAMLLAIVSNVCGCSETFRGPDPIITSQGTAPIGADAAGLVRIFFNSANASYSVPGDSTLAKQMLSDGFALIYSNCNDYFRDAGRTQQTLIFGRDLLGTFGTLATGIIALARASKDATAIVALATSTGYAFMDVISKDFLFAAENIDAVRELTLRAIQADQATVLTNNKSFSYQTVVLYLQDDQNYCSLRKIAELVKDAARNAPLGAGPAAPPANLVGTGVQPALAPPVAPGAAPPPPAPPPPSAAPTPAYPQAVATFQPIPIRVKPLQ